MLNQFTPSNFDEVYASLKDVLQDNEKKEVLRNIVRLKDLVSEWIWYLLGGSVAISSSYSILMKAECTESPDKYVQSHQIAMATEEEKTEPTVYTLTE
jgi:hypothetical protein